MTGLGRPKVCVAPLTVRVAPLTAQSTCCFFDRAREARSARHSFDRAREAQSACHSFDRARAREAQSACHSFDRARAREAQSACPVRVTHLVVSTSARHKTG